MNHQHPETPEAPRFPEVFRTRSELQKILWITGIWVFFSISQSIYDQIVLLSANAETPGAPFWTNLLINALATMLAGLIGGAILVKRLLPLEFIQIHTHRISQVTVQIVADHAAAIGKPCGVAGRS